MQVLRVALAEHEVSKKGNIVHDLWQPAGPDAPAV
jgi:hypothetical protein